MHRILKLSIILFFVHSMYGQTVSGKVIDASTEMPLIGATIVSGANNTVTDEDGLFSILTDGRVVISYIGYKTLTLTKDEIISNPLISLKEASNELDVMTVTGTRYERRLSDNTVSIDVIKPGLIRRSNSNTGEEILNKLPGVQIIGGQANIRGGSGFSYGAGSRVMILLDGMPALQSDAGRANWTDLPIENVGQIEVVKGAASSLYGSAALNGIINLKRNLNRPETRVGISYTSYLDPSEIRYKWWTDEDGPRFRSNFSIADTRNIGKLTTNAHLFYNHLDSYNKDTYERKLRGGVNLRYRLSDQIDFGVSSLYNRVDAGDFFIWRNALRGIYEPTEGTQSFGVRTRTMIDPYFNFYQNGTTSHKLQSRIYLIDNANNSNQSNQSTNVFTEYQFMKEIPSLNLQTTSGVVYSVGNTDAELFGDTTFTNVNAAIYTQFEKRVGEKLIISAGLRYEYNLQRSPEGFLGFIIPDGRSEEGAIISRLGLNYKLAEYSSIRASWGQGYRYPTITEKFISTAFGGFTIRPNPELQSETGWSSEIGVKQGVQLGTFQGYADISIFHQEYNDMIEFSFVSNPIGFQPINIGETRITGAEFSIGGRAQLGKIKVDMLGGYTYIDPRYKNFEQSDILRESISGTENVLKYRSRHRTKLDLQATWKMLSIGMSLQQASHQVNIDRPLEEPISNRDVFEIKFFREENDQGYQLLDLRAGLVVGDATIGFIMSNVFNQVYTIRPGLLEAPRNVSVRIDYKIR